MPFNLLLGEGSPTIGYRRKGTLILPSLLEDLVTFARFPMVLLGGSVSFGPLIGHPPCLPVIFWVTRRQPPVRFLFTMEHRVVHLVQLSRPSAKRQIHLCSNATSVCLGICFLFSPVGFKGNLSLLKICVCFFPQGLEQMEGYDCFHAFFD